MDKPMSLAYAAKIQKEDDSHVVTFRDLSNVFTQGDTYEEALYNAQEVLDILLLDMAHEEFDITDPTPCQEGEVIIPVSPEVAVPVLLSKLRKERHYTLSDVARTMGVSYQNYQQIESGKNITLRSLKRAAAALGATVQIIFNPIEISDNTDNLIKR